MKSKRLKNNVLAKYSLLILLLLCTQITFAQRGGGGGMRGGGMRGGGNSERSTQRKPINFVEAAGMISYDVEDVLKETKVDDEAVIEKVKAAFICYEDSLQRISFTHPEAYTQLNEANISFEAMMQGQDREAMMTMMRQTQEHIQTIRPITTRYSAMLNKSLEAILSKKEMKRWTSYFEKIQKEKLPPTKGGRQKRN